jgi:Holliday junction DNA helicase RuvA
VEPDAIVVDVNGVGYRVHVPTSVIADLGPEGATVTLHTYLVVRETEWLLIGAPDKDAIGLFGQLLSVSGVGPRAALALLSVLQPAALRQAILDQDVSALTRAPGVGRKTAERVVLELRERVAASDRHGMPLTVASGAQGDALEALITLGYSRGEAIRALAQSGSADDAGVEDRVLAALRALAAGP